MVDVNSCDANKILRAFEKIGNFIGLNANGVSHQVQRAFLSGVHYNWVAEEPNDPQEEIDAGVSPPTRVKL